MTSYHHRLPSLLSNLFRLSSYVFLQIIPTRLAQPILPVLYLLHLATALLFRLPTQVDNHPSNWHEKSPKKPRSTTTVKKNERNPLLVVFLSLPTASLLLTWATIALNTLLFLASADMAITPFFDTASDVSFTRIGAVYPDSVKIFVRHPSPNDTLTLLYREPNSSVPWKTGPRFNLTESTDWARTVRISNLWPSTSYEYVITDSNSTLNPHPIPFRTFPDSRLQSASHFRFLSTSCITPNFPYRGPFNRRTIAGFDHLARYLSSAREPATIQSGNDTLLIPQSPIEFLLFLGDFIYADVPTYIGDNQEAYRRLYRRNYQSPSFKKIYEQLPIFYAYDDHEFINNYSGDSLDIPPFPNASNAYDIYAGDANYDPVVPGHNFYDFRHGDVAFFVLDTRRYRSPPVAPITSTSSSSEEDTTPKPYRTMLGDVQLTALYDWLHKVNTTASFKFIVSSVPFTSLWTHDAQVDSWAGYADEKAALLAAFHTVPNLVILSGDRHEFGAIEFASSDPAHHVVREFSTSPMNMFYIPLIHTLKERSEAFFVRNTTNGTEEKVPYERTIAYIPTGNVKWSAFEVDTRDVTKPTLRIETVIDGIPAYNLEITGYPVKPHSTTGLGSLVPTNFKDLFGKIGLSPTKWF